MDEVKIHTIDSAQANSTEALRALEQLVSGFVDLRRTLAGGALTGVEREIVALATSIENDATTAWRPTRHSPSCRTQTNAPCGTPAIPARRCWRWLPRSGTQRSPTSPTTSGDAPLDRAFEPQAWAKDAA